MKLTLFTILIASAMAYTYAEALTHALGSGGSEVTSGYTQVTLPIVPTPPENPVAPYYEFHHRVDTFDGEGKRTGHRYITDPTRFKNLATCTRHQARFLQYQKVSREHDPLHGPRASMKSGVTLIFFYGDMFEEHALEVVNTHCMMKEGE